MACRAALWAVLLVALLGSAAAEESNPGSWLHKAAVGISKISQRVAHHSTASAAMEKALAALEGQVAVRMHLPDENGGVELSEEQKSAVRTAAWNAAIDLVSQKDTRVVPVVTDLLRAVVARLAEVERLLKTEGFHNVDMRVQADVLVMERRLIDAYMERMKRSGPPVLDEADYWYAEEEMPFVEYARALARGRSSEEIEAALEKVPAGSTPTRHDPKPARRLLMRAIEVPNQTPLYRELIDSMVRVSDGESMVDGKVKRFRGRRANDMAPELVAYIKEALKKVVPATPESQHLVRVLKVLVNPVAARLAMLVPSPALGKRPKHSQAAFLVSNSPVSVHIPLGRFHLPMMNMIGTFTHNAALGHQFVHPGLFQKGSMEAFASDKSADHLRRDRKGVVNSDNNAYLGNLPAIYGV